MLLHAESGMHEFRSVYCTSGSSLDGWGGGGGGLKRGGADCRRSRPGEGAGGGHPSRPARGYGGALEAPAEASAFCVGKPSKTTQKLQ